MVRYINTVLLTCEIITEQIIPPIVLSRVPSSEASRRTVKRRVKVIDTVREGASGNDSTFQFTAEVNYML